MQVFPIAPADARPLWVLVPVALVALGLLALLAVTLGGARAARFELSATALRVRGDFYGRVIPTDQLRPEGARRVDLSREVELQPAARSLGTGLPGYQSGWFRLRNGEKALLYLTDRTRAVYVPTNVGYSMLLSPADPDAFVSALRSVGHGG